MGMASVFVIVIISVCMTVSGVKGVEFTLDVNTPRSSFALPIAVCGVLKCTEGPSPDTAGSDTTGTKLASLTLQEPTIERVSDGIKVRGVLEAGRATLQMEMKKREDCFAQFTCEVRTIDGQGQEIVHTSRLQQSPQAPRGETESGSLSSGLALQQMVLLQQLDTKLALLGSSLDSKLQALELRFEAAQDHLEDKLASVQGDVRSFKDSITEKIETRVVDKLCQLDSKMSTNGENRGIVHEAGQCLPSLKKEFQKGQQKILSRLSAAAGKIEAVLNSTGDLHMDLTRVLAFKQKEQVTFANLTSAAQEIIDSNESLGKQIADDFSVLSNHVRNFSEISSGVIEKSENALFSIHQFAANTNASIGKSLNDVVNDIFYPKTCTKGMFSTLPIAKFPYPFIRPNAESILKVPYLCDTFTSGGGWIVIQRRTTGNTNFYRDWKAYKQGFGTLDDDFWLGNDNIHTLTSSAKYELRIDFKFQGRSYFAHYGSFSISDENNLYALALQNYEGTAGDSLDHERGRAFSTFDKDNDDYPKNCAAIYTGAWWYGNCHNSNLNGKWQARDGKGPRWRETTGKEPVTFSEMKIRRVE
ncbi:tenascin-R [Elysia marginata]|uniref:Tenascin-R n=1 Tax=Elysia marginata TaxID=1093978 RepID=A0AAV4FLW6_9GAST|nr:tenascin-R [Elysia marginata]